MSPKITPEHLGQGAIVYVWQSSMSQVVENLESQRRQYGLEETARTLGFASVTIIDDDLDRSGSGLAERPGFQRLVASVCAGSLGAVFCIEASRLARNGRDWHHLIDLCASMGTLVVDPDGTYDPRSVNDRLLLGLKGTMSEYELSLLRQRGLPARDSKSKRGELRFRLPPGFCWNELGQIEMDPDQRVGDAIRLVFDKFRMLGSARQVMLWAQGAALKLPVVRRNTAMCKIEWRPAAYPRVPGTDERVAMRQAETKPLMAALWSWLMQRLEEISAKSSLATAIRYTLRHWAGLTVFLLDGRVDVDNNAVERWAVLASLINTAKLHEIDPETYLADVLDRIVSGRTKVNALRELLPWNWKAARVAVIPAAA